MARTILCNLCALCALCGYIIFLDLYSSGLSALLCLCTAIFLCRITGFSATGGDAMSAG